MSIKDTFGTIVSVCDNAVLLTCWYKDDTRFLLALITYDSHSNTKTASLFLYPHNLSHKNSPIITSPR